MVQVLAISNRQVIFEYKNMFWSYSDLDELVFDTVGISRTISHFREYEYGYLNDKFTQKQLDEMAKGAEKLVPERMQAIKNQLNYVNDDQVKKALKQGYLAELDHFNKQVGNKDIFKDVEGKDDELHDLRSIVYI